MFKCNTPHGAYNYIAQAARQMIRGAIRLAVKQLLLHLLDIAHRRETVFSVSGSCTYVEALIKLSNTKYSTKPAYNSPAYYLLQSATSRLEVWSENKNVHQGKLLSFVCDARREHHSSLKSAQ